MSAKICCFLLGLAIGLSVGLIVTIDFSKHLDSVVKENQILLQNNCKN